MKRSYYIYNNGMLKRQDNSIAFVDENGIKWKNKHINGIK